MTGALRPSLRFHSPLIEPDVRISRIRLSDQLQGKTHDQQSSSCPRSLFESVRSFVVFPGSSPITAPPLFHKHARSEDPFLHQHYPVSSVLRSSPTPAWSAALATALGCTRPQQVSPDDPHCLTNVPCPLPRRIGTGAYVRFPSLFRAAFPVTQAGRHPHRYFRGLLRLHSRYGPLARSAAQGDFCHRASAHSVTRMSCLSATRSNRQLSRWHLPPLATRAYRAHCAKSRGEASQRAQRRGAILRSVPRWARVASGGRFHLDSSRFDRVADRQLIRVTEWVEAL